MDPSLLWTALFPLAIVLVALGLLWVNVQGWRLGQGRAATPAERVYRRGQFRRRAQASALMAIVGLALAAGQFISTRRFPSLFIWFWAIVILLVAWIVLLAVADAIASRLHISRLHHERRIERAALEALARQRRSERQAGANGKES